MESILALMLFIGFLLIAGAVLYRLRHPRMPSLGYIASKYPEKLYYSEGGFRVIVRARKYDYWGNEEYLNGFATVSVFRYPEDWERRNSDEKPVKEGHATYKREWARTHWWQTNRYCYVEEVAEEMKRWVIEQLAKQRSASALQDALSRAHRENFEKLDAQAKRVADEFHSGASVSGALSEVSGGEVSVVQDGELSPSDEAVPLHTKNTKKEPA